MLFLHSYLREESKKVKIGNYDALLIKAFTVEVNMGLEGMPSGPSEAVLSTLRFHLFPEMGKSFLHIVSRFLADKVFFCNKLEK